MQAALNANVQAAVSALATDTEFALALQTFFAADVPADDIRNAAISAALDGLYAKGLQV